ncbi:MAG: metallophosphoesterase family protein [Candidatus Hodarchaeaceae archaeon]|nr:metallophosphoesterase family protein [Candidatus Hodarchaeaceae archaeon]
MGDIGGKIAAIIPLAAIALMLSSAAVSPAFALAQDPPAYVYLTWASDDTAHSINVSWRTTGNYAGEVRYDTQSRGGDPEAYRYRASGSEGITTAKFEGYIHHVELTGLKPDTVYYFIAGHSSYGWSEERAFRTAPASRTSFSLVVGGDSRSDTRPTHPHPDWPVSRNNTSELMAQRSPSFAVFSGDFLWNGDDQVAPDTWDGWFSAMYQYWVTPEGLMIPIVPAIGNHEIIYPQPTDYDPSAHAMNYYALFDLPGNERWYALSWGPDLRIIVLDSEILDPNSEAWKEQVDWLGGELEASKDYLWKIVVFHRDMVSARSEVKYMIDNLAFLFDRYRVDLVLMSHFHTYERSHPLDWTRAPGEVVSLENGVTYVVSGGWGAPLYTGYRPKWFTAFGPEPRYHFVLLDIYENGTLHMRAIDANGDVFDELVIQKATPSEPAGIPIATAGVVVAIAALAAILYFKRK